MRGTGAPIGARPLRPWREADLPLQPGRQVCGYAGWLYRLLGNHILNGLILDPKVCNIYYLNCSEAAETRQIRSLEEKGLSILADFSSRVEFLQARFGAEKFGLSDSTYGSSRNRWRLSSTVAGRSTSTTIWRHSRIPISRVLVD